LCSHLVIIDDDGLHAVARSDIESGLILGVNLSQLSDGAVDSSDGPSVPGFDYPSDSPLILRNGPR
jgi:hypothetical protein